MRFARQVRRSAAVVVLVLTAACGSGPPPLVSRPAGASRSVVLRNVRVFDAPAARLLDGPRDVVVRDGRIAVIGPRGVPAPGLPEIDGRSATLLPGLVDLHTHTGSSANPPSKIGSLPDVDDNFGAYLRAGVTTALDLGSLSPQVFRLREALASGEKLGPRLYAAGPVFTAPGGHPAEVLRAWLPWYLRWYVLPRATREVASPEDARQAVAALVAERPDVLKITIDAGAQDDVPRLDVERIRAITEAGHVAGIRSIARVGTSGEALDAVRGGVDALAHAPWREELSDEAVAALAARRVPVVVTLAIWDVSGTPRTSESEFLPIERVVARPDVVSALLAPPPPADAFTAAFMRAAATAQPARRRSVAKLRAAGVTVLAGSDSCNPGNFPGAGLHLELAKLVEAGLTPAEALRTATWVNARFLGGEAADFGEVAVGKRADLVLVAGNPTVRLAELGEITQVLLDGIPLIHPRSP
jgi:imidazolonepropionase-like amidohydrolase